MTDLPELTKGTDSENKRWMLTVLELYSESRAAHSECKDLLLKSSAIKLK